MNKKILGIVAISMIALLGAGLAAAYGGLGLGDGFMKQGLTDDEKALLKEESEAIRNAVQEGDYVTWKSLMEQRLDEMKAQLTEENFNSIAQKHQEMLGFKEQMKEARDSGDYEKMQELREQYGIKGGFGKGMKLGHLMGSRDCPMAG